MDVLAPLTFSYPRLRFATLGLLSETRFRRGHGFAPFAFNSPPPRRIFIQESSAILKRMVVVSRQDASRR